MLLNEQVVRENLRNRDGKRVFYLSKGDQLTSCARDFLNRERIDILSADQARPSRYQLLGGGYLEDYVNAEIQVAREMNVEVIDLYHEININEDNFSTYLYDGLHFTDYGRQVVADILADYLLGEAE